MRIWFSPFSRSTISLFASYFRKVRLTLRDRTTEPLTQIWIASSEDTLKEMRRADAAVIVCATKDAPTPGGYALFPPVVYSFRSVQRSSPTGLLRSTPFSGPNSVVNATLPSGVGKLPSECQAPALTGR